MRGIVIMLGLAFAVGPGAALANDDIPLARAPSEMSGAEIDAHNQGLAATDPSYIRCRRIDEIGSLVKKHRICRSNAEWKRVADRGNQDARDSMETLARGWTSPQEPKDQIMPTIRPQ